MVTFVNAIKSSNNQTRTENGMKALKSSTNACMDLFYNIGAMRGKNVIPYFTAAFNEDPITASRIALWARDREGTGERQIFIDILNYLSDANEDIAIRLAKRVPDLGRWKDLLALRKFEVRKVAYELIAQALKEGNGLAAKWMPRKAKKTDPHQARVLVELRKFLGLSPKAYRQLLVRLTNVVETQMCARDWDSINFNHVPSLASSRYKKAFARHTEKYKEWTAALVSTDPDVKKTVKVNASAVYPYDVLKGVRGNYNGYNKSNLDHVTAQWEALPNFVGDASILPIVDVSGSMTAKAAGNSTTCLDIAVSLGLYLAEKNKGKFKNAFVTFSGKSELFYCEGNIIDKMTKLESADWEMNTNLNKAFEAILNVAVENKVPAEEMPKTLLILSDMQFDQCAKYDHSAIQMIRRKYELAGYEVPNIVFWNLRATDNTPVKFDERGTALVSGFSPAIMKAVLANDMEDFSPYSIMMKAISNERYNF